MKKEYLKTCLNIFCDNPTRYTLCWKHYQFKKDRAAQRSKYQRHAEFLRQQKDGIK